MSKILSVETSCDETSVALLAWSGERRFTTLSHLTHSQASLHAQYGGVFPAMARREHATNLMPLLFAALQESKLLIPRARPKPLDAHLRRKVESYLKRDPEMAEKIILLAEQYQRPPLAAIAVTYGPGLEIALWMGFHTARSLSLVWNCDLVPTNHMEGHIYASLVTQEARLHKPSYPSLALLISGGHTELVLITGEHRYQVIGRTLDDAVGEAYDKSARLLGLPYPGGPLVSQQAELARQTGGNKGRLSLPRPLLHSKDYHFSFSGLKTAVRTLVQAQSRLSKQFKQQLSLEFEEAVAEVLIHKTTRAIDEFGVKELIIGGGVSANTNLRRAFQSLCEEKNIPLHLPQLSLSGDNALMINLAGYRRWRKKNYPQRVTRVKGNLEL